MQEGHQQAVRRWVRLLTVPMLQLDTLPSRVDADVGRGLHLRLYLDRECLLHLCLTPAGDTPEAARKTQLTAVQLLGDLRPAGAARAWFDKVLTSLAEVEEQAAWRDFLDWAAGQPAVAIAHAAGFSQDASSGPELLMRITGRCNAACDFCSARGILPDLVEGQEQVRDRLQQAASNGKTEVSFTGGEPSLINQLPDYIQLAKELGFQRVDLQTNAVRLANSRRLASLVEAGLDSVFVSLHSADPVVHDEMLKFEGAFEKAVVGIEACLAAGLDVAINNVLTTRNLPGVEDFIDFIARRFGARACHVCLSICAPQGWAREHLDLMPRLDRSAVHVSQALEVAEGLGVSVRIPGLCGMPMCTIPSRIEAFDEFHRSDPPRLGDRAFLSECKNCRMKARCSGFWRVYLEAYGAQGLGPEAFESD